MQSVLFSGLSGTTDFSAYTYIFFQNNFDNDTRPVKFYFVIL